VSAARLPPRGCCLYCAQKWRVNLADAKTIGVATVYVPLMRWGMLTPPRTGGPPDASTCSHSIAFRRDAFKCSLGFAAFRQFCLKGAGAVRLDPKLARILI
jgi:hypothetical protein